VCVGSYTLTLTKEGKADSDAANALIAQAVTSHVPQAALLQGAAAGGGASSGAGAEIAFRLPLGESARFPALFEHIDASKQQLGVADYGLGVTTMEDVFLQVAHRVDDYESKGHADSYGSLASSSVSAAASASVRSQTGIDNTVLETGAAEAGESATDSPFARHFGALFVKRVHTMRRDRRAWVCQFALPLLLVLVGLWLLQIPLTFTPTPVLLSPAAAYNQPLPVPVYSATGAPVSAALNSLAAVSPGAIFASVRPVAVAPADMTLRAQSNAIDKSRDTVGGTSSQYGALFFGSTGAGTLALASVFSNATAVHGSLVFTNLGHNVLMRAAGLAASGDTSAAIATTVYQFPATLQKSADDQRVIAIFVALILIIAFCFVPASYAVFVVRERESNAKHLQTISGVNLLAYWAANFAFDALAFFVTAALAALITVALSPNSFAGDALSVLLVAFALNGLAVVPFTYLWSHLFSSHSRAQSVMIMVYFLSGVLFTLIALPLQISTSYKPGLFFFFSLFPNFSMANIVLNLAQGSNANASSSPSPAQSLWSANTTPMLYMGIECVVYFVLAVVIDHLRGLTFWTALFRSDPVVYDAASTEDADAQRERARMQLSGAGSFVGSASGGASASGYARVAGSEAAAVEEPALVQLRGLRKSYEPNKLALKDLWFEVKRNEVFGFLGVNGTF
jgi:ATP-binding cassette subfamily A (ABC1) protein 3